MFVTHAQNRDASAFKSLVEETLAGKVVQVLEGLKAVVASQFFMDEEGGASGGVSSVKKKPTPPAAGSVKLPGQGGKEGGLVHAGRSSSSDGEKSGEAELPGQKGVSEGKTSGEPNSKGDKVSAVQKDKKPKLPQKKGSGSAEDRKSMD